MSNDKNDYFPVWGTCLGLEAIAMSLTNNSTLLDVHLDDNVTRHPIFIPQIEKSKLFSGI
jgi:hypothetical protein